MKIIDGRIDGLGPVLTRAKLVLIFSGSGWVSGLPSPADTQKVLAAILASPYMSSLVQYRGIRRAEIVKTLSYTTDIGNLGPDPRNPPYLTDDVWRISDDDIRTIVKKAVADYSPPKNEETFYLVAVSQSPQPIYLDTEFSNAGGYHSRFQDGSRVLTYGTVLNLSTNTEDNIWNSLMCLPAVLVHELVEACSDPDTSTGFHIKIKDDKDQETIEEIADLQDVRTVHLPGLSRDIGIAAYWSDLEDSAVVPTSYSVRVALGKRRSDNISSLRSSITNTSVRTLIFEGCNP